MTGLDWDIVRVFSLNKRDHAEDASSPRGIPSSVVDIRMDADGDSGPGFAGRHPTPRRRLAYRERPSRRVRRYYRQGDGSQ